MRSSCKLLALLLVPAPLAQAGALAPYCAQSQVVQVTDSGSLIPGSSSVRAFGAATPPSGTLAPPPVQLPGFPLTLGAHPNFAPWRSGVIEDLDRDGDNELLVATTDGRLHGFDGAGTPLPGFPVFTIGFPQYAPSVADLEGDGTLEIVQFTRGLTDGGRLYVLDASGAVRPGYPISVANGNLEGSPTLADLDDDGQLEILVPQRAWPTGFLRVFEANGVEWGGNWPLALSHVPTGSPAVADLDGDGILEIAYTSYDKAYLLHADGSLLAGWPKSIANANFSYQSPAFGDLDGDSDLEVVFGAHQTAAGYYAYQHSGALMPGWPKLVGTWTYCPPTIADLEHDGTPEILGGRDGTVAPPSAVLFAWTPAGTLKPGFPYWSPNPTTGGGCGGAITVADIDGDGISEVFSDHNTQDANGGYLFGVDAQGVSLPNFPIRTAGFTYQNGPIFGDLNGDGNTDMVFLSYALPVVTLNAYDLGVPYRPADVPWGAYHQDNDRSGRVGGGRKLFTQGLFQLGGSPSIVVTGKPGEIAVAVLSLSTGNAPLPTGWWHLGQSRKRVIRSVVIPASGQVSQSMALPSSPAMFGVPFYYQGIVLRSGGGETTNVVGRVLH